MNPELHTIKPMKQRQKGVTLIELMIALVISSLVMVGVVTVYSSSKRSYVIQEEYARLQENARYAIDALTRDIRQAGYAGCNPKVNNLLDDTDSSYSPALFNFYSGIDGWDFTTTSPGDNFTITTLDTPGAAGDWNGMGTGAGLPPTLAGQVLPGNDVLVVKSASNVNNLSPVGNTPANAATITFGGPTGITAGSIVIISDCKQADVFQNQSNANANNLTRPASGSPGNVNPAGNDFSQSYQNNANVQTVKSRAFFIGPGASGEPALHIADYNQGTAGVQIREVVESIENMQVLYGVDTTPNDDNIQPNQYVPAGAGVDPDDVISVRVSIMVRTPQELFRTGAAQTNLLLGVDAGTGVNVTSMSDQRARRVFTTTVYLRNKGVFREQ